MSLGHFPTLVDRQQALRREVLHEFDRTAFRENYWLTYSLLGWTNMLACAISHYFVQVLHIQDPWPYLALWIGQVVVALAGTTLAGGSWKTDQLPLLAQVNRIGTVFVLLCFNVAALNVLLGLPVFELLPVLATLSSFTLLMLAMLLSPRLLLAALAMFLTGPLMAWFPKVGFLLYGTAWLLILQTLGVIFFCRRKRWLNQSSEPGHEALGALTATTK